MHDRRNRQDLPSFRDIDLLINRVVSEVRLGDAKRDEALEHYRNAGQALIELKKECQDGGAIWLSRDRKGGKLIECSSRAGSSRTQLGRMMTLAREWPVSWDRWQEIQGHKKPAPPKPRATPKPGPDDLDHAAKLADMRDRGGTPNEREVAAEKLARFASTFDLTADVLETKAKRAAQPQPTHTDERETDHDRRNSDLRSDFDSSYRVWLQRVQRNAASLDRETLLDIIARLHASLEIRGHDPVGDQPSWERG